MAIRTSRELLDLIKQRIGDSTSDEDLAFIEDASDTINNLSGQETRVAELESENESLRQKYRDRFFEPKENVLRETLEPHETEEKSEEKTTFESLFKEV